MRRLKCCSFTIWPILLVMSLTSYSQAKLPTVAVISTGGTIAEKTDPLTGGAVPALTGKDLIALFDMDGTLADYEGRMRRDQKRLEGLEYHANGLGVMPAQPANEGFEHPKVIRYDGTNLDEVRTKMLSVMD